MVLVGHVATRTHVILTLARHRQHIGMNHGPDHTGRGARKAQARRNVMQIQVFMVKERVVRNNGRGRGRPSQPPFTQLALFSRLHLYYVVHTMQLCPRQTRGNCARSWHGRVRGETRTCGSGTWRITRRSLRPRRRSRRIGARVVNGVSTLPGCVRWWIIGTGARSFAVCFATRATWRLGMRTRIRRFCGNSGCIYNLLDFCVLLLYLQCKWAEHQRHSGLTMATSRRGVRARRSRG